MDVSQLYELLWGFAGPRVVTLAAKVGLLRALAQAPADPPELAAALKLDLPATGKIVRALCAQGLLEVEGEKFRLHPALRKHFRPGPDDLTPFVAHAQALADRWGAGLEDWLRSGAEKGSTRAGDKLAAFSQGMQAAAALLAHQVVEALDGLLGIERVLDLGGGTGGYARVFCSAQPRLQVTVLEVAEVAALGTDSLVGTELGQRIHFISGDYHQSELPAGQDLVLLANVLHIEKAAQAQALVQRAAASLAPGGRLAVVDFIIDEHKRENLMGALFAINMRSRGDTYSEPELRAWLRAAGLAQIRRVDLPPAHWLILGQAPAGPPGYSTSV